MSPGGDRGLSAHEHTTCRDDPPDRTRHCRRRAAGGELAWADVETALRSGEATCWLSVRGRDGGVHTRPLFAPWTGDTFVLASKSTAAKTGHLAADGAVSLALHLADLHLVVEGAAARLTSGTDLQRASDAMREV